MSYFEADAYARWAEARLPTEAEWEVAAAGLPIAGHFLDSDVLHPRPSANRESLSLESMFGNVWEWTSSAYLPYPGFITAPGAVGEYNGKFMINQHVLRGGCCVRRQVDTSEPPIATSSLQVPAGRFRASGSPKTSDGESAGATARSRCSHATGGPVARR